MDVQIRETLRLIFSGDEHDSSVDWLLQKLSAQFVSKDDVQVLLRDLELQILRNITHHISVTRQMPTSETIVSAVSGAGISGITEAVSGRGMFKSHGDDAARVGIKLADADVLLPGHGPLRV